MYSSIKLNLLFFLKFFRIIQYSNRNYMKHIILYYLVNFKANWNNGLVIMFNEPLKIYISMKQHMYVIKLIYLLSLKEAVVRFYLYPEIIL